MFDESVRRKLAALNANLTLADITFQEIRDYQRKLHGELRERRRSLWQAVADVTEGVGQDADLESMLIDEPPALGDVAAAEERFNTCLAADPYQVECLLQRAGLYLQLERDEQALADCDAALAIEPSSQSAGALRDRILQRRAYRSAE